MNANSYWNRRDGKKAVRRVGQVRRRDANEKAIVKALEAVGAAVFRVSGKGAPDLLVYYQAHWLPVEVKTKGGSLTTAQIAARVTAPYPVVSSVEEALQLFGVKGA